MTTNNLTKLWKKGKLEDGWYYVSRNNDIEMLEYVGDYFLSVDVPLIDDKDVSTLEVLAPVPSYKEWQTTLRYNKVLDRDIKNIIEMNGALGRKLFAFSELVKECREALGFAQGFYGYCKIKNYPCVNTNNFKDDESKIETCLTKIDEVLK